MLYMIHVARVCIYVCVCNQLVQVIDTFRLCRKNKVIWCTQHKRVLYSIIRRKGNDPHTLLLNKTRSHYDQRLIQILMKDCDQHRKTGIGDDYNTHSLGSHILWSISTWTSVLGWHHIQSAPGGHMAYSTQNVIVMRI